MIQLSAAGKRFGHKLLFENADWLITTHDRVGLVGANGTGKSTLMKVLAGLDTFDYGSLIVAKGTTAGYLPQDGLSLSGRTVFAECMSVFDKLRAMEQELEALTHSMAELDHTSPEYADVADRYHRIEHEFRTRDGYSIEAEVGRVLMGLGFRKEDWERRTEEFSGGWQMRLALAKLLLQQPNLLLLDEPTNHLDLEARNWLEEYLHNYPHAFVLISHDRYFLDVTVNKIAEIWNKRFWFYTGNYDKFLSQKTQRNEQLQAAYRNQRDRIEQLEVFINRFRYQATKAKQVQSRIKELEKIERIEIPPEPIGPDQGYRPVRTHLAGQKPDRARLLESAAKRLNRRAGLAYASEQIVERRVSPDVTRPHQRPRRPGTAREQRTTPGWGSNREIHHIPWARAAIAFLSHACVGFRLASDPKLEHRAHNRGDDSRGIEQAVKVALALPRCWIHRRNAYLDDGQSRAHSAEQYLSLESIAIGPTTELECLIDRIAPQPALSVAQRTACEPREKEVGHGVADTIAHRRAIAREISYPKNEGSRIVACVQDDPRGAGGVLTVGVHRHGHPEALSRGFTQSRPDGRSLALVALVAQGDCGAGPGNLVGRVGRPVVHNDDRHSQRVPEACHDVTKGRPRVERRDDHARTLHRFSLHWSRAGVRARQQIGDLVPVRLVVESGPYRGVKRADLARRAKAMLDSLQMPSAELSVLLTGDDGIQRLNYRYRGHNRPTDVLAFAQREGPLGDRADRLLGDVVVSVPTARRQAQERGRGVVSELTELLAHGLLHLLGYDHDTPSKDRRMRRETERLCAAAEQEHTSRTNVRSSHERARAASRSGRNNSLSTTVRQAKPSKTKRGGATRK